MNREDAIREAMEKHRDFKEGTIGNTIFKELNRWLDAKGEDRKWIGFEWVEQHHIYDILWETIRNTDKEKV